MTRRILLLAVCLLLSVGAIAQTQAPTVSEIDNLKLDNALKDVELWEMREAMARTQKERAIEAANGLIRSLQRDGFEFDIRSRIYTPKKDGGM